MTRNQTEGDEEKRGPRVFVEQSGGHPTESRQLAASNSEATVRAAPQPAAHATGDQLNQPADSSPEPAGSFRELGLSAETLAACERAGYTIPTPVQAGLIPRALAGVDVLGQARTGTGKTAAFVLPILERMTQPHRGGGPRALVLVPTRELAVQVRDEFEKSRTAHGYIASRSTVASRSRAKLTNSLSTRLLWLERPAVFWIT